MAAEGRNSAGVFSRGLRFALANAPWLFLLSLGPMVLRVIGEVVAWSYPLRRQDLFLVVVGIALAESWQLSAIGMYTVERLRGGEIRPLLIGRRALESLPKVFLSYAAVLALFILATSAAADGSPSASPFGRAVLAMVLLFSFFLLWAPAFVVGELYAKEIAEEEEDDGLDVVGDEEFYFQQAFRPPRLFSGMSTWHLGLERSYGFSVRNFGVTLQLIVYLSLATVLPIAFTRGAFGHYERFFGVVVEAVFSVLLGAIVYGASMIAFFLSVPREARDEIALRGIEPAQFPELPWPRLLFVSVIVLGSALSWYVSLASSRAHQIPDGVRWEVTELKHDADEIYGTVRFEDDEYGYRWLIPANLRLGYADQPPPALLFSEPPSAKRPDRLRLYDEQGEHIGSDFRPPRRGTLSVRFYFPLGADLDKEKEWALFYHSFAGEPKLLSRFRLAALPKR